MSLYTPSLSSTWYGRLPVLSCFRFTFGSRRDASRVLHHSNRNPALNWQKRFCEVSEDGSTEAIPPLLVHKVPRTVLRFEYSL